MSRNIQQYLKTLKHARPQIPDLRLPPLPSPKDLVRIYNLRARKQLAQNFLLDPRITDRIVKFAGKMCDGDVCEVGPGPGSITRSILKKNPGRLLVIEKDDRFLPSLDLLRDASQGKLDVILGDVLLLDMSKMFREEFRSPWNDQSPNIHIIGNLPFNVSTPLIIRWLRDISQKQSAWNYGRVKMTLTFQKEVAERMVAPANHPQRCRLSVMCQNWCSVKHVLTIPGSAFVPPPEVDVGVVTFKPKVKPTIDDDFYVVEKVIRQTFTFRQKSCLKCVRTLFPNYLGDKLSQELMTLADINVTTKPYQLTNDEFLRIVQAYRHICDRQPNLYKYDPCGGSDKMFWKTAEEEFKLGLQEGCGTSTNERNTTTNDTFL